MNVADLVKLIELETKDLLDGVKENRSRDYHENYGTGNGTYALLNKIVQLRKHLLKLSKELENK